MDISERKRILQAAAMKASAAGRKTNKSNSASGTYEKLSYGAFLRKGRHTKLEDDLEGDEDTEEGQQVVEHIKSDVNEGKGEVIPQDEQEDDFFFGPPIPREFEAEQLGEVPTGGEDEEDGEKEEESSTRGSERTYFLPLESEASLTGGTKPVLTVALDYTGSRVATGSGDYSVKFYNFAGMDRTHMHYSSVEPAAGNVVCSVDWSSRGTELLISTYGKSAFLYDRDGKSIGEFPKGDQYLTDVRRTNGHVAALTNCAWNPLDDDIALSSSRDGTIRIWNLRRRIRQIAVAQIRSKSGSSRRTQVLFADYDHSARQLFAACSNGSIHVFDNRTPLVAAHTKIQIVHGGEAGISRFRLSEDDFNLVARCTDDSLRVWDLRQIGTELALIEDLSTFYDETGLDFSPDGQIVVTGTSAKRGDYGQLVAIDTKDWKIIRRIDVAKDSSVISVTWNPQINQILMGCADGVVRARYDSKISTRGFLLSDSKTKKRALEVVTNKQNIGKIINPHALPMFQEKRTSKRRKYIKARQDPKESRKPEEAVTGRGKGGKLGQSIDAHLMSKMIDKNMSRFQDPREAILNQQEKATTKPMFSRSYEATQPQPIYRDEKDENAE